MFIWLPEILLLPTVRSHHDMMRAQGQRGYHNLKAPSGRVWAMEETQSLNFVEPEASIWKCLPNTTIEDLLFNKVYVKQKLPSVMNILRMQLILVNAPITFVKVMQTEFLGALVFLGDRWAAEMQNTEGVCVGNHPLYEHSLSIAFQNFGLVVHTKRKTNLFVLNPH